MYETIPKTNMPSPEEAANSASIQDALTTILSSSPFRTTRQCQDLLRYMVERTVQGQDKALRERIIGIEVFGRKPDYDTSEDPVVRIRAADVRRRLAQFYQGLHGAPVVVRIDIPPGSYRAAFEWHGEMPAQAVGPLAVEPIAGSERVAGALAPVATALVPVTAAPVEVPAGYPADVPVLDEPSGRSWRLLGWVCAGVLLAVVVIAGYFFLPAQRMDARFKQFWSPFLQGSRPTLICMGSNVAYQYSHEFMVKYLQERHIENGSMETYVDLPPDTLVRAEDVHRARDSFVALGDVAAASRLVATLTRRSKAYEERFPPDISFAELQNTPTILVGGFNNPLTIALTKDLRFVLARNSRIEDRQDKTRSWAIQFYGDARDTEDYAIVTRLLHSKSGGPVLTVAGIGQYGTQGAAEFVSNPQMIADLIKAAPAGWKNENVQVVLHLKIIDFRPVSTEVVGAYYW